MIRPLGKGKDSLIDLEDSTEPNDKLSNKFSGLCKFVFFFLFRITILFTLHFVFCYNRQLLVEWQAHNYRKLIVLRLNREAKMSTNSICWRNQETMQNRKIYKQKQKNQIS